MGSSLQTHFLHYWVNRRGAFTLEQAVRKMTHDNAQAFELKDRGLVREGYNADLVLFEADRVRPNCRRSQRSAEPAARRLVQKGGYRHRRERRRHPRERRPGPAERRPGTGGAPPRAVLAAHRQLEKSGLSTGCHSTFVR